MEIIPIKKVVSDLRELFELDTESEFGSSEDKNKFHIDKRQFERFDVIGKLQNYFRGKTVKGGYLKVDSLTFIHTTFEVLEGKPTR